SQTKHVLSSVLSSRCHKGETGDRILVPDLLPQKGTIRHKKVWSEFWRDGAAPRQVWAIPELVLPVTIRKNFSGVLVPFCGRAPAGCFYSATTLMTRVCAARLRCVSSRIFFRSRRFFGVASTYSSGPMYSRARSSESLSGALSWMPLPSPCDRMLVSFFAL